MASRDVCIFFVVLHFDLSPVNSVSRQSVHQKRLVMYSRAGG